MKWFEVWYNPKGSWEIYEVTEGGNCYRLYKIRKSRPTEWAKKQKCWVKWR